MMVHDQFKNQDTKFFNQHKNEPIRIPSPNVLPNGQKPDFGNSSRSSKKQAHHNQKPQQRLPNGQMPDFGNSPKNNNNNNNKKTDASKTNNRPKSNNKNNNNNQRKSPLSSPKTNSSQINNNNYELSFQKSAPVSAASSSSSKTPSFAGSTFSNSPQTSSIPKPTFL